AHEQASVSTAMVGLNAKRVSKRILQDDQDSDSSQSNTKMFCSSMNRKIRDIFSDRQTIMSASSSANISSSPEDSNDSAFAAAGRVPITIALSHGAMTSPQLAPP